MTSPATTATGTPDLPGYAPLPALAKGPPLNEHGYHVWQVERNLYAVTDNVYMSAFLTTPDGVVIFDAPPNIGHNIQRAVDEITAANGLTSQVTHMVYSHHHCDHQGASSLFGGDIVRIGHPFTARHSCRTLGSCSCEPSEARNWPMSYATDRRMATARRGEAAAVAGELRGPDSR